VTRRKPRPPATSNRHRAGSALYLFALEAPAPAPSAAPAAAAGGSVEVVVPDIGNTFFSEILGGIEREALGFVDSEGVGQTKRHLLKPGGARVVGVVTPAVW